MAEDVPKKMSDDIEDEDEDDEEKELTLFDQIRDALPAGVTTNAVFIHFPLLFESYCYRIWYQTSLKWALDTRCHVMNQHQVATRLPRS